MTGGGMKRPDTGSGEAGFTLIEVLAALALASLILVSLNLAMSGVRQSVDRARESLSSQAALSAAADIFAGDAARILKIRLRGSDAGAGYLFEGSARSMVYPMADRRGAARPGLYLVRLTVQETDGQTLLVRDRAPLTAGGEMDGEPGWTEPVTLLEGGFDIAFAYRAPGKGVRAWSETWSGAEAMPEQLRLTITDRATGRLRMPVLVQALRVDAEPECAAGGSGCGMASAAKPQEGKQ